MSPSHCRAARLVLSLGCTLATALPSAAAGQQAAPLVLRELSRAERSPYAGAGWNIADGLPQNFVTALVQTSDGYIWIGTQNGLARFNGVTFSVITVGNTPALRSHAISALAEGRDGAL
jgi:hypothetical protein